MTRSILILIAFLAFSLRLYAQHLSEDEFNKLITNKRVAYFDDANKRYFGCGLNLDCRGLPVFFNNIIFDKSERKLVLSGFVNPNIQGKDTVGTNIFRIFIAKPTRGKLTNIRLLAEVEDTVKASRVNTTIDLNRLSFETEFSFSRGDRLYVESSGLFRLKEYDIGTLLRTNKFTKIKAAH